MTWRNQPPGPAGAALAGPGGTTGDAGAAGQQARPAGRRRARFRLAGLRDRAGRAALGAAVPVLLLAAWQLAVSARLFPSALIPAPLTVLSAAENWLGLRHAPAMFYTGHMVSDIRATGLRVIVGFALAAVAGCVTGTAIGVSHLVDGLLSPLLKILGPIPAITWIPVAIVFFGVGQSANFALTFIGAVFPVVAATATAVSGVSRDLLRAGRMMSHGRLSLIVAVVFPAAFPGIVGGLRIGLGLSWMMAVTSEMLGVNGGLGYTLWNAYDYLDYPAVFAAMIVTGVCGLVTDGVLIAVTSPATRWHAETGVRS